MIFYTKETATCYLTVRNEMYDNFLTEKEKKIIKKIIMKTKKNGGKISKEDSDTFYEIERRVSNAGGMSYCTDESIDNVENYEFQDYDYFEADF